MNNIKLIKLVPGLAFLDQLDHHLAKKDCIINFINNDG